MNVFKTMTCALGVTALLLANTLTTPAVAHETVAGDLTIAHPHARPNLPNRPSAAYMTISNNGAAPDALLSASSDAFSTIEIHTMHEKDGVMHMMPIKSVEVPADGSAALKPGGMHLMLFDAKRRFKVGDSFEATLTFEKAGKVKVTFKVEKPKHNDKKMDHSGHGAKHDHNGHGSGS